VDPPQRGVLGAISLYTTEDTGRGPLETSDATLEGLDIEALSAHRHPPEAAYGANTAFPRDSRDCPPSCFSLGDLTWRSRIRTWCSQSKAAQYETVGFVVNVRRPAKFARPRQNLENTRVGQSVTENGPNSLKYYTARPR